LPKVVSSEKIEPGFGSLKYRQLRFGIIAIFVYVGGEVAIGSYLINFIGLKEVMDFPQDEAKNFLAWYWGGLMIGRFMGSISLGEIQDTVKKYGFMLLAAIGCAALIFFADAINRGIFAEGVDAGVVLDILSWEILPWLGFVALNFVVFILGKGMPARTLAIFASVVILLLITGILTTGSLAFYAILAIGLFNSIMWSNIFTLSIDGLGKYTSQGSSLLVMAIVGGAVVPFLQGGLADYLAGVIGKGPDSGLQLSFIIPMLCYVYILFYGLSGYKHKENTEAAINEIGDVRA
jgi:FHS family L-fucose permease-like MFS transporter